MARSDDILKKYGVTQVTGGSGKTASSSGSDSSGSSKSILDKYGVSQVRGGKTYDAEKIRDWFSGTSSALQSGSQYLSQDGYRKPNTSFSSVYEKYMDDADDVARFIEDNKSSMENYGDVLDMYNKSVSYLRKMNSNIQKSNEFFSQFSNEDDYNTAVRYSGYYQKYNGQTYGQLKDTLSKLEDGEEKDWLTEFAQQTMTDRDFGVQAAQYNTDIYYAQKYLDEYKTLSDAYGTGGQEADERILSQMQALSEKYGFKNKQEAESALSRLTGEKWMLDRERKYHGLEQNADFNLESAVAAEAPTAGIGISYGRKYYGVGDAVYDYINGLGGSREYAIYSSGEDGHVNPYEIYNYMKEDEIKKYNYLYNTEGKKSADDYLDYLEYTLNARRTKRLSGMSSEFANEHPHLADITSVPLNLMGGLGAADAAVQNAVKSLAENVTGEYAGPVDYNSWGFNANTLSSGIRITRSQNLADKYGYIELSEEEHPVLSRVLNGKNVGELYQLGMSMLDSSAIAMLYPIIGSAGTYLLGGSAATQSVLDSVKNGASDEQALMIGLLCGAAEVIFEKYELENLLGLDTNLVKAFANHALTEGVGEGATTIANTFSDILVMGDKSEYMTNVRKYQNQGMSTQKAELNAFMDAAISVGWDAIGGLLSGGIMGAVASPIENTAQKYSQAKEIYGSEPGALVTEALEINPNNKFAQKMQGRIESGKDLSGYQLNRLVNQNEKALRSQDIEAIRKSAENRLNDLGESGDVSAISAAIAKQASGKTLSSAESSLIKDSKYGTRVLNELNPDNIRSGGYASEWAMEINSQRINQDVYNRPDSAVEVNSTHVKEPSSNVGKTVTTDLHTSEQADGTKNDSIVRNTLNTESKTAQNDSIRQSPVEDKPFELSDETGKTLLNLSDGSTVETEIISIASTGKGKLMLNVAGQSEPVRASSISYASTADATLYNAINSMEISPEDAKRFVNLAHSSGDTTGDFAVGIQQMYILGKSGVPISKAMNSRYGAKLSDTNKRFGYSIGRAVYDAQVQKAEAEKKNVAASQRARASAGGTKVNGVQYDGLTVSRGKDGSVVIEGVNLNAQQKAGIQAAEMLAGMGVNIHVFQSRTDANGKPIGENGSYHLRDGSIHIDLNAGNLGQGVMVYTIAHEFTHFMEQQSPAKFQAFTDALFAELDVDVEAEIEDKAEKLKRQHPEQYRNASRETLLEDARSEVVAEACETMLTDTDAAQRIGKTLQAKDATLFEKVKQWFRDLAAKLREAYKGLNPDSQIAQYAKKTIQQVDGLVQMWADMAVDAAENYREGTGNENAELDSGVKMQLRYADGNSVVWIEENILKENDGEPVHQYIANYIAEHIGEVYTIIESGQKVYIGEDLPGEYTQSKYTKAILKNNAKVLKAKNRAAANLGEMIEIATNRRWEETKHTHSKDAKYGIYRYDTRFGFPIKNHQGNVASANVYNAELLIRNASDGKKYLYDIVSIKKDTASSDWLTKKAASAAANAAGQKGDVSRNSIRNTEPVVNQKNSERNSESGRVKYSNRDSAYMDAIKRGDMKTAQKMVEQAAKDSGYTRLFYHGSKKGGGFKIFRDWQYFTENKEYAKRYTDRGNAKSLYTTYVKMDNPFDTRIAEVRKLFRDARMEYGMGELQENGLPDWTDGYDIADFIDENDLPYDSIVLDEGGDMVDGKPVSRGLSYVIRKSNQIKSADIITYDDSGNVIPLSQRFNTQNNDIRYSDRDSDGYGSMTYAEISEEQQRISAEERDLQEQKRNLSSSPELVKAMDEYSDLFSEMKDLLSKRRAGKATQEELDRIEEIKSQREYCLIRIADIQESNGLNEVSRRLDAIRNEKEDLRKASDAAWAREGAEKENKAIQKSGLSSEEYFRNKAIKEFRYTTNFNEAGYLLPDGKMLNFSGGERNHRYRDHREIGTIYEATHGAAALNRFMSDGNIRIMAESPGIDIASGVAPTSEQYSMIRKFVNSHGSSDRQFFVDFSDKDGRSVGKYSYEGNVRAERVLNDIKYFFENGTTREQSDLGRFLSARVTDSSRNASLEKQNEKLREDVERLRELLKLQGKTTGGKLFKPESIKTAANFIMRETGRSLDADGKAEFAGILTKAYTALSDENVTYDDIIRECTNVAQWLDENGETQDALDEYAGGILSEMKGTTIRLDETQKAEARHLFGSLREFRSRIAGTYKLSPDGVPLDDVWNGLSMEHPMFFDGDASSAGLPGLLVEAIDRLRGSVNTDPYQHMPVDMMMRKVYDGFWKARKLTTVADRYQSKIDAINAKHDAAMQEMQDAHKAEIADLNRQWDEEAAAMEKSHKYDLQEQERLHKEHLRQVREEMNHDAEAELEKVIGKYRDQRKASVENRHRTQYREQIYKMADKFHKMATAPAKANTAHAPIQLVNAVSKFCEIFAESEERALEYAANRLDSRETELRLMNDLRGETKTRLKEADAINRQRERIYKKHQAVSAMKEQYSKIQNDPAFGMFYDNHVDGLLESLSKQLDGTDIYDMNTEQLKQVYSTMQAMMYTITNANRVFSMEKDKTLIGVTRKLAGEIDANKISHGAFVSGLRDYGMWQMSPDTFFNFVCGFKKGNEGKAIQRMFVDGIDRMLTVQRDFYQMFRHLTEAEDKNIRKHIEKMMKNPMKEMIDWGLKDAAGNSVKTTRDMMLQAYMLLNQKDSFDSLIYGGFKLPNAKDYYNGKIDRAYGNAEESSLLSASIENEYGELVRQIKQKQEAIDGGGLDVATVNQIQEEIYSLREQAIDLVKGSEARLIELRNAIEEKLTDADLDAIETAKRWYKFTGQLMTDVYLQMYGYRPNLVDGYVPIHRDLSTVKTDIREGEEDKAFNLENSGFTKDRVKSRAPILLTGFFQELQSQQIKISRYYGFAQVQKDFNRIWNMRVPGYGMTINGKVAAKFGTGKRWLGVSGEQYVLNYIQSLAGVKGNDDILSSFYGNAASATLSANPRVAVSQLASIPTAAAVVGWKSMAKGFAKGIGTSISTEKKNLLANDSVWFFQRYRGAGGITEISDLKAKGGFWGKIANSPVGKALFNWCQSMDVFATASMWAMAEDYVQQGGMKPTDDGYKLAVEQCYADIIRRSQPNYTVTERSDLLRDKRGGMKLLTMYKTQSNQNLNILINSIGEYRAAATAMRSVKNETTIADFKAAKNNLINGVTSVAVGGTLVFVLLRTMINFIMAKVDPYRDDETDELTMESAMGAITQEIFSSISGMFALGGQLYDIVNSVVSGDNYYGISDSAISSLAAVPENMVALIQRWKDPDKDVEWKHVEKVLSSSLALCGIPYKNLRSFYDAAGQWYRDLKGGTFWQYVTDATDKQYRARILKAWQSGDMEKINDTLAILAAKSEEDTDEDILKDVTHGFANNYLKDKVKDDEISPEDAADLLKYIGHDDPDGIVQKWVFQVRHPDIDSNKISDKLVSSYNQRGDINEKVFLDAYWFASSAQADKDKDGKSINGSKKAKIVKYIQSIPGLTFKQQKRLYILLDVGSLKDTPWE